MRVIATMTMTMNRNTKVGSYDGNCNSLGKNKNNSEK